MIYDKLELSPNMLLEIDGNMDIYENIENLEKMMNEVKKFI